MALLTFGGWVFFVVGTVLHVVWCRQHPWYPLTHWTTGSTPPAPSCANPKCLHCQMFPGMESKATPSFENLIDVPWVFQCSFSGVNFFFFLSADWYLDTIDSSRLPPFWVPHYTITCWLILPSLAWSFERKQLLSSLLHGGGWRGFEYLLHCMQISILWSPSLSFGGDAENPPALPGLTLGL